MRVRINSKTPAFSSTTFSRGRTNRSVAIFGKFLPRSRPGPGSLRPHDAVYVALALNVDPAFMTLDSDVRSKVAEVFPSLSFVARTE